MDELKIMSGFSRSIVSKIVKMFVKKKTGYDVNVDLNRLEMFSTNEKVKVHIDINAELSKDELEKILKSIGVQ